MSREDCSNGPTGPTEWNAINWRRAYRMVQNLRQRIYRATAEGDLRKVRSLQKLMLRSYANQLVGVRKVAQQNTGKHTPGVDQVLAKTPAARGRLVDVVRTERKVRAHPVRRVYIPKSSGKMRPLGIPAMIDRAAQAVVKNALEPQWEARFEPTSYGFRPGRSAQDAMQRIHASTHSRCRKQWVVDADIKGCFDNIDHGKLLETLGTFPARREVQAWLKAGYMEDGVWRPTDAGTPQGGVISPLLANIALHGLEQALGIRHRRKKNGSLVTSRNRAMIRYADDFVVLCKTREDAEQVVEILTAWLGERGLALSKEKTRIVHVSEGFDFLGFNVRQYRTGRNRYGTVTLIKPSKTSVKNVRKKLSEIWATTGSRTLKDAILMLNPVVRGWSNYFRGAVSARTFKSLDDWMFHKALRFVLKRHPNKGKRWVIARYFTRRGGDRWVFRDPQSGATLLKFSQTKVVRHVLVRGYASPDDPSLAEYWEWRRKGQHSTLSAKHRKLARAQNWLCPVCGDPLENGEPLRIHYAKTSGGKDDIHPHLLMHLFCHQQAQSHLQSEAACGS